MSDAAGPGPEAMPDNLEARPGPPGEASPDPDPGRRGWWARIVRAVVAVFVVGSFLFWVWAFSPWARTENPNRIDDRAFAAWAEQRCATTQDMINALPSPREAASLHERADQVDRATSETERLVRDLQAEAQTLSDQTDGDGPADVELLASWFADWERYLQDRRDHSAKLRTADPDTDDRELRFLLSDVMPGGIYTERMDGFARLNNMDSCEVPGDV